MVWVLSLGGYAAGKVWSIIFSHNGIETRSRFGFPAGYSLVLAVLFSAEYQTRAGSH